MNEESDIYAFLFPEKKILVVLSEEDNIQIDLIMYETY